MEIFPYPKRHYSLRFYCSPQQKEHHEIWDWLWQNFGPVGERWDQHGGTFKIRDEKDALWVILRWSEQG